MNPKQEAATRALITPPTPNGQCPACGKCQDEDCSNYG